MKQTQNWRRLDGSPIRQDIRDEVRFILVKEKQMGHAIKHFKSNDALKEAMGYIMGWVLSLKPNLMHLPAQAVQIKWYNKISGRMSLKTHPSFKKEKWQNLN